MMVMRVVVTMIQKKREKIRRSFKQFRTMMMDGMMLEKITTQDELKTERKPSANIGKKNKKEFRLRKQRGRRKRELNPRKLTLRRLLKLMMTKFRMMTMKLMTRRLVASGSLRKTFTNTCQMELQ